MSERQFKWKEVGKTAQRLNSMLSNKKQLPQRFAPPRDHSDSIDKLFNNSRSRLHSSMEVAALNNTHDDDIPNKNNLSKMESQIKKEELNQRRSSANKMNPLPTVLLGDHQSSLGFELNAHSAVRNNQLINDLKKQFWAFRQNILHELDRQRQMVQKLVKEIVLTMELQLQKISSSSSKDMKESLQKSINSTVDTKVKTIQQWKNTLGSVSIAPSIPLAPRSSTPSKNSSIQTSKLPITSKKDDQKIQPPKLQFDFTIFVNNIQNIKRQFLQMDKIFDDGKIKEVINQDQNMMVRVTTTKRR